MTTLVTCSALVVAGALIVAIRYRRLDPVAGTRCYIGLLVVLAVVQRLIGG